MAIVLKNSKLNITLDSNKIIGIMGEDYDTFLRSICGQKVFYIDREDDFQKKTVCEEIELFCNSKKQENIIKMILQEFNLNEDFLKKYIDELSSGEKRIFKYFLMFVNNPSVMIINDAFQDLDYFWKKKIIYLLKKVRKHTRKTIIIGSRNSDDLYLLCDKILLLKKDDYCYDDTIKVFSNLNILKKYDVFLPSIIEFINYARKKGIRLDYCRDIRDLMKEVYKSVL